MSFDLTRLFIEKCPSLKDTFSGREEPCPGASGQAKSRCPHAQLCYDEAIRTKEERGKKERINLGTILASSYQARLHITLAEPSGSFVIRSEHHFHGKEMFRMLLRWHLYEVVNNPAPADGPAPLLAQPWEYRCPSLVPTIRLGQYIGYVDLRKHYKAAPLALGMLAVPRKLRVDPDAHVIFGNYSPLFGGPAFPCTLYSQQDGATAGAACAQACMIMVLGMLSDRGAQVEGSYTLTQLGFAGDPTKISLPEDGKKHPEELVVLSERAEVNRVFPATTGLSPRQIVKAFKQQQVNAVRARLRVRLDSAQPAEDDDAGDLLSENEEASERLAQRIVECYIQARYPVILGVEAMKFYGKSRRERPVGHAVTVVGIRKHSAHLREERFVIHDPAQQPFMERSVKHVLDACWASAEPGCSRKIVMILPTEESVKCSLVDCLKNLQEGPQSFYETWFGKGAAASKGDHDYQFSLLYHKDIHTFLWPIPLSRSQATKLDGQLGLQHDRYWCLASYKRRLLEAAWLFPSDLPASGGPEALFYAIERDRCFWMGRQDKNLVRVKLPKKVQNVCFPSQQ